MKVKRLIMVATSGLDAEVAASGLVSPMDAARLADAFLRDTLTACGRAEIGADVGVISGDVLPADFSSSTRLKTLPLSAPEHRLGNGFETAFAAGYAVVCVVESHSLLPSSFLQEAYGRLTASPVTGAGMDMVLGPTDRGSCCLVGLRRLIPDLLGDSASPADLSVSRAEGGAQTAGVGYHLLPRCRGVKTVEDLSQLQRDLRRGVIYAPETAKVLDSLSL